MMYRIWLFLFLMVFIPSAWSTPVPTVSSPDINPVTALAWEPSGQRLAVVDADGMVAIWDTLTGQRQLQFSALANPIWSIAWNPAGTRLVTASTADGLIHIWDTSNGKLVTTLQADKNPEGAALVRWSPTGEFLATVVTSTDGFGPHIWRVNNDQFLSTSMTASLMAFDMSWKPNSSDLAIADWTNGIFIFSGLESNKFVSNLIGIGAFGIAWSPNGDQIAGFGGLDNDGIIHIYDTKTLKVISTIEAQKRTGKAGISSLGWSVDGSKLFTDDYDGSVTVFDVATGRIIKKDILPRTGGRGLMAVSPYGGRVALGNAAPPDAAALAKADPHLHLQSINGGQVQIVVLAPSQSDLTAIMGRCGLKPEIKQGLQKNLTPSTLSAFTQQVKGLSTEEMPPGCAADLVAVAEALQVQ